MIYSGKTLVLSAILFLLSTMAIGAMSLPVFEGQNGIEAMGSTFNSLRKGLSLPFDEFHAENRKNLGKSFSATLTFRNREIAQIAAKVLLRNKLMVTPKELTLRVQGDLGYTLQYFMRDIELLYLNRNRALESKYAMPATQAMFALDRILKGLAISLASKKMTAQEQFVNKIREKELVPAYNLRNAPPINIVSGFTYITIGTFGLLLIATLWDLANLLLFRTITDSSFLKKISGTDKIEKKAELIKQQKERKKKAEALTKKVAAESATENKNKPIPEASQKPVKKVTSPAENKKKVVKAAPQKVTPPAGAKAENPKKATAPKTEKPKKKLR